MNRLLKTLTSLSTTILLATTFTASQASASSIAYNSTRHAKETLHARHKSPKPLSFKHQNMHEYVFYCPFDQTINSYPSGIPITGSADSTPPGSDVIWTTSIGIDPIPEQILPPAYDLSVSGALTPAAVPVPAALWLMVSGLLGIGITAKKMRYI